MINFRSLFAVKRFARKNLEIKSTLRIRKNIKQKKTSAIYMLQIKNKKGKEICNHSKL